jgi:3D (Asp-Asp-Asp) domain-containing protein
MKTRTKVIIAILVGLFGMILMINHLFDKKVEPDIHEEDYLRASAKAEFFEEAKSIELETKSTTKQTQTTKSNTNTTKKVKTSKKALKTSNNNTYKITHYGANCKKCSGITASGHNVKESIWYVDNEYKKVRIVATSKNIPLYSIIKIHNYKLGGDITAIVLDRGVGNGIIDLLVDSEETAKELGIQKNVEIEILRNGR